MKLTNINFLKHVWSHTCEEDDFVFLSTKSSKGNWNDHCFKYGRGMDSKLSKWFNLHSDDRYDLYFCPLAFSNNKRSRKSVKSTNILWSDIDYGDSYKVQPTLLWSSSPDRYQGLWLLDKKHNIKGIEQLNKDLAYYIGADKGGWDLTQVLRIPGTQNHKYKNVRVGVTKDSREILTFKDLRKEVPSTNIEKKPEVNNKEKLKELLDKYKSKIPADIKRKLISERIMGDRSKVIWSIENSLLECGIPLRTVFLLIKNSVWNKFKGRPDEDEIIKRELNKAMDRIKSRKEKPHKNEPVEDEERDYNTSFSIETCGELLSSLDTYPGWLVEGFWLNQSHGIVAGVPKSFKSTLSLDFAVSVASGRNFLGKYMVNNPGPVVYIQNENAKWIMKDRMEKIIHSKGLSGKVIRIRKRSLKIRFPQDIPIHFINAQSYLLNDENHRELTEKMVEEYKPRLIVFDPLYLMYDGDLNAAKELNPILGWLLKLKNQFNCAVMLIHHYNKGNGNKNVVVKGGQRMLGSTTIHGWIESAWYIDNTTEDEGENDNDDVNKAEVRSDLIIEREFRGAGLHPKAEVTISMGSLESSYYKVETKVHHKFDKGKKYDRAKIDRVVMNFVLIQKDPVSLRYIASQLSISRTLVKESVDNLVKSGMIDEESKGVYTSYK